MPSNKTRNTLARQWELLKLLPTRGAGKTAKEIADALAEAGFAVSKRQVERDLLDLQEVFGLECNDSSIPYGWRWGSSPVDLPELSVAEALSLKIVESTLKPLVPRSVQKALLPKFSQAASKLQALADNNKTAGWINKVEAVSPSIPVIPPEIDEAILETVQLALLNDEKVEVTYRTSSGDTKDYVLNPLGLVARGAITYLIATAFRFDDPRTYAVHRLQSAVRTYEAAERPEGFELANYLAEGRMGFGGSKPINIVLRVADFLARVMQEVPIAVDQKILSTQAGYEVKATVAHTWQLEWWILSKGPDVTIISPPELREKIADLHRAALDHYTHSESAVSKPKKVER